MEADSSIVDEFRIGAESCDLASSASSQDELFEQAGHLARSLGVTDDASGLARDLRAREHEMPTGLMDEFAIPHAKSELVKKPSVLYLRTEHPIPWHMLDGNAAQHFFVLLVSPKDEGAPFVGMLSKLATCLMDPDFRSRVSGEINSTALGRYLNERIAQA